MSRSSASVVPLVLYVFLLGGCAEKAIDAEAMVRHYVDAFNRYDTEALGEILAEDVIWDLGSARLRGKQKVLRSMGYEEGVHAQLTYENVVARSDTIDFEIIRTDGLIEAFAIGELRHYLRFLLKEGLIQRRLQRQTFTGFEDLRAQNIAFRHWLQESSPDTLAILEGRKDSDVFSSENGRLAVAMAQRWRAETDTLAQEPDTLVQ
jgi:hypothetical protein